MNATVGSPSALVGAPGETGDYGSRLVAVGRPFTRFGFLTAFCTVLGMVG